jgi:hypothetical protein
VGKIFLNSMIGSAHGTCSVREQKAKIQLVGTIMEIDERCGPDRESIGVAIHHHELAIEHAAAGRLDQAEACCRESIRIFEHLFGTVHPDIAMVLRQLGAICQNGGSGPMWRCAYPEPSSSSRN